jgi:hypothetical protein
MRLTLENYAASRLLLPAVQRAMCRVWVVDGEGNLLLTKEYVNVNPPPGSAMPAFFDVAFDITTTEEGLVYSDRETSQFIARPNEGGEHIIAILIGLYLPGADNISRPVFRSSLGTVELVPRNTDPNQFSAGHSIYLSYEFEPVFITSIE